MTSHLRDISFTLTYFDEEVSVNVYEGEFRNLMVLINEKIYVEDFGECKGIGRCGTCLIEIESDTLFSPKDRNEESTLNKCAVKKDTYRLACQVMINDALQNAVIKVVEEREDVR